MSGVGRFPFHPILYRKVWTRNSQEMTSGSSVVYMNWKWRLHEQWYYHLIPFIGSLVLQDSYKNDA